MTIDTTQHWSFEDDPLDNIQAKYGCPEQSVFGLELHFASSSMLDGVGCVMSISQIELSKLVRLATTAIVSQFEQNNKSSNATCLPLRTA